MLFSFRQLLNFEQCTSYRVPPPHPPSPFISSVLTFVSSREHKQQIQGTNFTVDDFSLVSTATMRDTTGRVCSPNGFKVWAEEKYKCPHCWGRGRGEPRRETAGFQFVPQSKNAPHTPPHPSPPRSSPPDRKREGLVYHSFSKYEVFPQSGHSCWVWVPSTLCLVWNLRQRTPEQIFWSVSPVLEDNGLRIVREFSG